ncbi:alpha/beta-hydrolase [Mollisia scopiformis]|uniref:Alpha/beta-hydrolase n=1 Tax=Mollisia scopiformis TaxID=149040 RepID=A0A194WSX1_MOLSC|nr:alpha/beta-hydrolase [Mollisia scopiformis]KUJ11053.1 alpha/beta-hydrolase [Mollisia scopiformis]
MSSEPSNTAIILIPGSFSPPSFFHKIVPLLSSRGYLPLPTALQSAGSRPQGPATFADDVAYIKSTIQKLVDEGKDVVLAMNSYGGFPGTEATQSLSKKERQSQGLKGGVIALVYLASFLPGVGESLRENMGDDLPDSIKNAGDYMTMNYEEDWKNIFNDLPEEQARYYMNQMPVHSTVSLSGKFSYPGYLYIPTTYFLTEKDKIISPENQEAMVEKVRGLGGEVRVVRSKAGHVPMLSAPEEVVEVIVGAAKGQ